MTRGMTLAQAARQFWRYPSPWMLAAARHIADGPVPTCTELTRRVYPLTTTGSPTPT